MYEPSNKFLDPEPDRPPFSRTSSHKFIQTLNVERLQKHILALQNQLLQKQLELYDWRQKTDFPIVKIDSFRILYEKIDKTHLEVIINSCPDTLAHLKNIKLQDLTALIKEAFIGFQRLYNKFRAFEVKPQMIVIDQRNKCRVWINSNFSLNQVEKQLRDFDSFYKSIINVFERVTVKNPISINFYLNLKNSNCFIKGLKFIENFLKSNKLKPNPRPQFLKKINSTPNFILPKPDPPRLHPIEEQSKNMRQTIGYLRKKQTNDFKHPTQAMTFAGKNTRPLQKRLQQMIQQIPSNQIAQKNNLVLDKFKQKPSDQLNGENLKKVFRTIKDFKFRKPLKDDPKIIFNPPNCQIQGRQNDQKFGIIDKFRSQTTRPEFENSSRKNYQFVLKNNPHSTKQTQEGGRFSVTETRCTSFFNNSGERFAGQENSTHSSKKFGNIKFSEISHKKNSEMSDFNKEIENILFSIDGNEKGKDSGKKENFCEEHISTKSLHHNYDRSNHNYDRSNHNFSILENEDGGNEGFNKLSYTKVSHKQNLNPLQYKFSEISASAKYGEIDDEIEEPSAQEISRKYIELGWKNTFNIGSLNEEVEMKESIHAGDEKLGVNLLCVEKKPVMLGKLDRIKNKGLVQSVMNDEFFGM